jgi:hypothetical protein
VGGVCECGDGIWAAGRELVARESVLYGGAGANQLARRCGLEKVLASQRTCMHTLRPPNRGVVDLSGRSSLLFLHLHEQALESRPVLKSCQDTTSWTA